jgi:hypothetical protein
MDAAPTGRDHGAMEHENVQSRFVADGRSGKDEHIVLRTVQTADEIAVSGEEDKMMLLLAHPPYQQSRA